jgi:peptidoglycan/LPS O-acetylase OafA/YrhL
MVKNVRRRPFNASLNGYRGLCALVVFGYHIANAEVIPTNAFGATLTFALASLQYGVELFFMISGFVICGSLIRHATISAFLLDRAIRIFPVWVPALIVVTAVCSVWHYDPLSGVSAAGASTLFVANLFLLPPLIPLPLIHPISWSLTYEWIFYLAGASGLTLLRSERAGRRWWIALWIVSTSLFVAVFPRALFFVSGTLVFCFSSWFERHRRWLRGSWLSLLLFLITWHLTAVSKAELSVTMFDWARDGRLLLVPIAMLCSVHTFASVTLQASGEFAFLESRAFQFLGKISYSLYIWHLPVIAAIKRALAPILPPSTGPGIKAVCIGLLAFVVSVLFAWVSQLVLEDRLPSHLRVLATSPGRHIGVQRLS